MNDKKVTFFIRKNERRTEKRRFFFVYENLYKSWPFLINMNDKEEDSKQKTKNIKITVENTQYLKKWLNNYLKN